MRLKARNFNWLAGRPVIILDKRTADNLNIHVDERVELLYKGKKLHAVVDIFSKLVKTNEVGLSYEISRILKTKQKSTVEVSPSEMSESGRLIKKKLSGETLTKEEINTIISELVANNLTEPEISYFVAAEKIQGMSIKETIFLINAMVKNGKKLKFKQKLVADKHCIGGIAGNRTSPLVVAICASEGAGLIIPKTSSRAITSASGTADVVETIANVEFSSNQLKKIINKTNASLAWGGALNLAPSDDKIIHVERILHLDVEPQLLASIMAKKIASGSKYVLIDIPYGKGAKVESKKAAIKLGKKFKQIAKHFKLKLEVVYTDGRQPIGNGIGPTLEMLDILAVLQNKPGAPQDLKNKSLYLSAELMKLCKIKNSKQKAKQILDSGKAYEKFKQIINTQNNSKDFEKRIKKLKLAKFKKIIRAKKSGKITQIDNRKINSLCRILGTPETKSAGVYLHKHVGKIKKSEKIITIYSESKDKLKDALKFFSEQKPVVIK